MNLFVLAFLVHTLATSCKKKDELPTLTTSPIIHVTGTFATSGGTIISEGTGSLFERGICWGTVKTPTIADRKTSNNIFTGANIFICYMTELTVKTLYHVRAYATNQVGTAYGNEVNFTTTSDTFPVTDVDGNSYKIVTIGTQLWMKENLKTTKYNDGTSIQVVTDALNWRVLTTGAYCDYENTPSNSDTYGRLYNWYVAASANPKNVCPTGWHVPNEYEWGTLVIYIGGGFRNSGKLEEPGTTHGFGTNDLITNETGFTARPGGMREYNGSFLQIGFAGHWWSAIEYSDTTVSTIELNVNGFNVNTQNYKKNYGFSVRCLAN